MPFVQMENISHFLRACQSPPLNLQSHDIFQTVDLYESKDPAQVLQCISSFSRRAHAVQPSRFANAIGEKSRTGVVTPQSTGDFSSSSGYGRPRGASNTSGTGSTVSSQASQAIGGRGSPFRSSEKTPADSVNGSSQSAFGGVSSWSKRTDEGATTPAWNIHQYGYMGGASQGNQGIAFGARRQITTPGPKVPSLAEKERKRREQENEAERLRVQAEEAEHKRRVEREAEDERQRLAEEKRWEEETRRQREVERKHVEEEKRRWEVEEKKWKEEEEARAREEREAEARLESERQRKRAGSDAKLKGQFLSQYQAEQSRKPTTAEDPQRAAERDRVKELERQLEEAKEREAKYELERQERIQADQERGRNHQPSHDTQPTQHDRPKSLSRNEAALPHFHQNINDCQQANERNFLGQQWEISQSSPPQPPRPLPTPQPTFPITPAPPSPTPSPPHPLPSSIPPRPLPNPATYTPRPPSTSPTRKSPFARPSPPRTATSPSTPAPLPNTTTTKNPQRKPPSSLLSREMEADRARQAEWEEAQQATRAAAESGRKDGLGTAPGDGAWDTSQYGFLGGDGQNKGGRGIGVGRRQLVGPREMGGK